MKPFLIFTFLLISSFTFSQEDLIMFPGDLNNDGIANHFDLLPLGIAIFDEGIPRELSLQDIHWIEHPFVSWDQVLPVSGINYGFLDSNGNGFIDTIDLDAIVINYDSIQSTSIPAPQPYSPEQFCDICPPPTLALFFDRDTALVGEAFFAEISILYEGEVSPEQGVMGFAFDLEYNPAYVKDNQTTVMEIPGNEDIMLIAATSSNVQAWRLPTPGRMGMAASGRKQNAFSFTRPVATLGFIVEDMILRSDSVIVDFSPLISKVLMLNKLEQRIDPIIVSDHIVLVDPNTAVKKVADWERDIKLFPNPARERLQIFSSKPINSLEVFNLHGQLLSIEKAGGANSYKLQTNQLKNGLFLLKIHTNSGIVFRRFEVTGN